MKKELEISHEKQESAELQIIEKMKHYDYDTVEYPIEVIVQKYHNGLEDDEEDDNHPLCIIKNRRNWLAHGNQSFNECSRDTTIEELKIIKDESIDYMRFILEHIQTFINNKKYKATQNA